MAAREGVPRKPGRRASPRRPAAKPEGVPRRARSAPARAAEAGQEAPPLDLSPSRYIMKMDRATGAELPDALDPEELLVHAHRDDHPVEIAAQFAASRVIRFTRNEALVKKALKTMDRLGG